MYHAFFWRGACCQVQYSWYMARHKSLEVCPNKRLMMIPLLNSLTLTALPWSNLSTAWLNSAALPSRGWITDGSNLTNFVQTWPTKTTRDRRLVSWPFSILKLHTRYHVPHNSNQFYGTTLKYGFPTISPSGVFLTKYIIPRLWSVGFVDSG